MTPASLAVAPTAPATLHPTAQTLVARHLEHALQDSVFAAYVGDNLHAIHFLVTVYRMKILTFSYKVLWREHQ